MDSKVAIITGAAGGLGKAVAHLLADKGHRVMMVDNRRDALEDLHESLKSNGADCDCIQADLIDTGGYASLVSETITRFGGIDILVNAAAILDRKDIYEVTPTYFDRVFSVNARAIFFMSRAVMAEMSKKGWGRIVNCTSVGVYQGGNTMTSIVYEGTKGAVSVLTKMFASYGASKGILVNTVCPAGMKSRLQSREHTPQHMVDMTLNTIPLKRMCEPVEVARMVEWLVSEENTYATGATFDVVGGRVMN